MVRRKGSTPQPPPPALACTDDTERQSRMDLPGGPSPFPGAWRKHENTERAPPCGNSELLLPNPGSSLSHVWAVLCGLPL